MQKKYFICARHRKTTYCLETQLLHFVLAQCHPQNAKNQVPCFGIEYSRSHRPFLSRKLKVEQNINITVTFLIFNKIIFLLDGFQQPHHPPIIPTMYTVILKHGSLCFHYVKFPTIVGFTSSYRVFFNYLVLP